MEGNVMWFQCKATDVNRYFNDGINSTTCYVDDNYNNNYVLELAKWQYRTGTGFLLTANNKNEK